MNQVDKELMQEKGILTENETADRMTAIGIVPFFSNVFVKKKKNKKMIAEQYVAVI